MKIEKQETLYSSPFMSLESRLYDNGDKRLVVTKSNSVGILLYNTDINRYILVRQFRPPLNCECVEVIAGHIDPSDKTCEDAAIREVSEETGYNIRKHNLRELGAYHLCPGLSTEFCFLYYAEVQNSDKGKQKLDKDENVTIIEVSKETLKGALIFGIPGDAKSMLCYKLCGHFD